MIERYTRRRAANAIGLGLSVLATLFGLFWLAWLLVTLVSNGIEWIRPELFVLSTPPPGRSGGLANAIVGSLLMTLVGTGIGAPVGVLAGTYLSEFGRGTRFAQVVRFINDVLLSAPSIIMGVFIYGVVVAVTGHFSGWAGALALSLIVAPIVLSTTEEMMRLVPDSLREAAAALGAPRRRVVISIVFRAARPGVITGLMLAVARISGETAPLLFTALNNQFWSTNMRRAMPNLPVVIFQFAMSPYPDWHRLAWSGALIITTTVLVLNILARFISRGRKKAAAS
jgi:phosphate transport system permease protein